MSGQPVPRPYHRWQSNENVDHPASLDRCLVCGCRRWSDAGGRACPLTREPEQREEP